MKKYRKAVVAVIGVVLTGLNVVFVGNPWVQLAISAATAAGVYQVPNTLK